MKQQAQIADCSVRPSDILWQEGGAYYTESPAQLRTRPILPDLRCIFHRRLAGLFELAGADSRSDVLEIGCGASRWLPHVGRAVGCTVSGIEIEPFAAELARANLAGAGVKGTIFCRDAFSIEALTDLAGKFDLVYSMGVIEHFPNPVTQLSVLARLLKPGGRILTTVPNLQGVNGVLQQFADRERYEMHVVYNMERLASVHEAAGFTTSARGYVGFVEGLLTAPGPHARPFRREIHRRVSRAFHVAGEVWSRVLGDAVCPELDWLAPHVFYIGTHA